MQNGHIAEGQTDSLPTLNQSSFLFGFALRYPLKTKDTRPGKGDAMSMKIVFSGQGTLLPCRRAYPVLSPNVGNSTTKLLVQELGGAFAVDPRNKQQEPFVIMGILQYP